MYDDGIAEEITAERMEQRKRTRMVLGALEGAHCYDGNVVKFPTNRKSCKVWMLAVDNQLCQATGKHLMDFHVSIHECDSESMSEVDTLPFLSICADQG